MTHGKKIISSILVVLGLAYVGFSAYSVYAAGYGLEVAGSISGLASTQVTQAGSIPSVIGMVISVLLALVGVIFFILILFAGFTWMTAAGSTEKVEKSKKMLQNSAIGLVAVLSAYTLANFLFSTFLTPTNATCATVAAGTPSLECDKGTVCSGAKGCTGKECCVDKCKYLYKDYDTKVQCIDVADNTAVCDGNIVGGLCGGGVNNMCCITKAALTKIEAASGEVAEGVVLPPTAGETTCEKGQGQFCISLAGCTAQNGKSMGQSDCGKGKVCCQNCARAGGTCIDTNGYECDDAKNLLTKFCHGAFGAANYKCCVGNYTIKISQ